MTTWDLNRLVYAIRNLTGLFDETQIPTVTDPNFPVSVTNPAGIVDYINDYYLLDMDEEMRTLKLKNFYEFSTIPNVGTYSVPQEIYQLSQPNYSDGYQYTFYESPDQFYRIWSEMAFVDNAIAQGDGGTSYAFTLTQTPVQQGTITIGINPNVTGNAQYEIFTDADSPSAWVNPSVLTGDQGGTGTINYLTGAVTLNYANVVPSGVNINAHYHPYVASRPRDVMFYQQQIFVRPIPNDSYKIKMISYVQPTTAMGNAQFNVIGTDSPMFNEWWQLIAYGAALKILVERGDHSEVAILQEYYERQKLLAQRRALKNLASQRIPTRYSEEGWGTGSWPVYPMY